MDDAYTEEILYVVDEIYENQKTDGLPITAFDASLDNRFNKKNLTPEDPSPWVDGQGATCNPATFPLRDVRLHKKMQASRAAVF